MHILIAPDKFKDSLNAIEVCDAIARGAQKAFPDATIDRCPMSDGGEGFVDALVSASGGRSTSTRVTGPLPEMKIDAKVGWLDSTRAVIEMSSAAGLAMLPAADRNPMYTTTFGVGELMVSAVNQGARKILLGVGGSATCDAGIGCLQACGCHIILRSGGYAKKTEPLCGRDMDDVVLIKSHRGSPLDGVEIIVACDVTSPLFGESGAALVFGRQKGASQEECRELDRMLQQLAERTGTVQIAALSGSGAAGGIGFGLRAFLGAGFESGFELVASAVGLAQRIDRADVIITAEGRLDSTSFHGKLTARIAELARSRHKTLITLCGDRERQTDLSPFGHVAAMTDLVDRQTAIADAHAILTGLSERALRALPRRA